MKKLFFLLCLLPWISIAQPITSSYSDTKLEKCKSVEYSEEGEYGVWRCKGVAGYNFLYISADLRESITILDPQGREHELNFTSFKSGFSSLGPKLEWRMTKKNGKPVPIAAIIRFSVSEDPDDSTKITSYLAVSRVGSKPSDSCVIEMVPPGPNQNAKARQVADSASRLPCLTNE